MKVEPIAVGCIANGITHRGNVYDQSAVDALQDRIAELEKDAARYRWLKSVDFCVAPDVTPITADAAIDAAMAGEQK